ncbi:MULTISPECIES: ORF6C domain-containing protein [Paenibacillus]|nr:ORF6C domain-containing protein [Paenibacillus odorifer]
MPDTKDILLAMGQHLQLTEQQGAVVRSVFEGLGAIKDEMIVQKEEVLMALQEVRDRITLDDVEQWNLQQAVKSRSNALTKDRYKESDVSFNALVGKYRRLIWSKLKDNFSVAKYSHIRRIDYDDAVEFIKTFRPEDYL